MAIDMMVDSAKLNREMLATANALREKGKTEAAIPWEDEIGFEQAVLAIKGGADLNFEVIGGTKPSDPKENTIWIDTDVEIAIWSFSVAEPTAPVPGMVWLKLITENQIEINAIETNQIILAPGYVKQYVDGEWQSKPAECYRNGKWIKLARYLYYYGNEIENVTGGWSTDGWKYAESTAATANIGVVKNDDNIQIGTGGDSYSFTSVAGTNTTVNITSDDKTLIFVVDCTIAPTRLTYWTVSTKKRASEGRVAFSEYNPTVGENIEIPLDVSSLNGSYYIGAGQVGTGEFFIKEVYLT